MATQNQSDAPENLDFMGVPESSTATEPDPGRVPGQDYISPVLDGLAAADTINMPPVSAACRHCPASIWMLNGRELTCYCQPLHVVIWSNEQRACPERCDAQIAALAQLQARKARG